GAGGVLQAGGVRALPSRRAGRGEGRPDGRRLRDDPAEEALPVVAEGLRGDDQHSSGDDDVPPRRARRRTAPERTGTATTDRRGRGGRGGQRTGAGRGGSAGSERRPPGHAPAYRA